jgi:hypothetical protein
LPSPKSFPPDFVTTFTMPPTARPYWASYEDDWTLTSWIESKLRL